MSDVLRLITIGTGGQATTVRDYENGSTYVKARNSFKATMPQARQVTTSRDRRFAGGRVVSESHDNAAISWTAEVSGASTDLALANVSAMVSDLRYAGPTTRFIEFRADGATYSTLYEIRGPAVVQTNYEWARMAGVHALEAEVQIPVAPLTRGLPMDVLDDYSMDTEADYTYDSATAADTAITGGTLTPVVGAALTVERRLRHTVRGYTHLDSQQTAHGAPGTTITSYKLGVTIRASATTYVEVYVDDNGTNSRLRIDSVVAGTPTNRASTNLGSRVSNGTQFWVRGRIEGNVVIAEYFTSQPTPTGAPVTTNTYTLTSGEQTSLVAGHPGLTWIPQHASAVVYDWQAEPFTYRSRPLPDDSLPLKGTIPGDAPALADITITCTGVSNAPIFALVGWTERPAVANMVWNGDFEDTGTDGWSVALVTGVQAVAGTSITRDTTAARVKYGTADAVIVTPASSGAGANFPIYRRFKQGITYTAALWASAASSVTSMVLKLGVSGSVATSSAAALTTTPTLYTVTWTPPSDVTGGAFLSIQTNAATATTFNIDAVQVYEGTTAPTIGRQAEGAGAPPPFGIIEAESADNGDLVGWAIGTESTARTQSWVLDTTVSGAETYAAGWWIDPNLLLPDDFTLGEVDVEVWARMAIENTNVSPRVILSARPEAGTSFGAERFTAEWQSAGALLTIPSAGLVYRMTRLGTLTLPVDPASPARWKLWLAGSTAAGSTGRFGLDFLVCALSRYRASSPSGKVNDTTYPKFITSVAETAKTITSDLRGRVAKPPLAATADRGLGGTPLELPPGNVDLLVLLSSLVPDDPTSSSASEVHQFTATIHASIWPRYNAYRST